MAWGICYAARPRRRRRAHDLVLHLTRPSWWVPWLPSWPMQPTTSNAHVDWPHAQLGCGDCGLYGVWRAGRCAIDSTASGGSPIHRSKPSRFALPLPGVLRVSRSRADGRPSPLVSKRLAHRPSIDPFQARAHAAMHGMDATAANRNVQEEKTTSKNSFRGRIRTAGEKHFDFRHEIDQPFTIYEATINGLSHTTDHDRQT